jgi:8-oxo-dGTP diphosphatase
VNGDRTQPFSQCENLEVLSISPMASESPNVRVGVGAFILKSSKDVNDNPQFLVGKRLNSHGAGSLALPGGHLEFGETLEECSVREVKEETGLNVLNVQFLTATNDYMPQDNKHYVTMFMVCAREDDRAEPQVLEPDKCEAWEWVSWEDLKSWAKEEIEAQAGKVLQKKLFTPLLSLVKQRPGVVPSLK